MTERRIAKDIHDDFVVSTVEIEALKFFDEPVSWETGVFHKGRVICEMFKSYDSRKAAQIGHHNVLTRVIAGEADFVIGKKRVFDTKNFTEKWV